MSDFFSRLAKVALLGRRGDKIAVPPAPEDNTFKDHEAACARFARGEGSEDFLQELRRRRDAAKDERRANARDHIALVSAMRAEDCFEEVIQLLESYKVLNAGQPETEALTHFTVGEGS